MNAPPCDRPVLRGLLSGIDRIIKRYGHRERLEQWAALVLRIASAGLGYALLTLAARVADSLQGFSDFALVMSATALFGAIGTMGQETMLLRQLPIIIDRGGGGYRNALRRGAYIVAVGLAGCALLGMIYGAASFHRPDLHLIGLTGLLIVASGAAEFLFAIQRGGGQLLGPAFRREIVWKAIVVVAAATMLVCGVKAGPATLAQWYLLGTAVTIVLSVVVVSRRWRSAPVGDTEPLGDREGAGAFFALNLIVQAGTQLDVLVLGLMSNMRPVELGAFYAAQRTIQILYILPYGASMAAAPRLPLAWANRDRSEITRMSRQVSRNVAMVVIVLVMAALLFGQTIMALFRPEFATYAALLPILALGPLFSVLGGLHGQVAPMCGLEQSYARYRLIILVMFLAAKVLVAHAGSLNRFALLSALEALTITAAGVYLAHRRLNVALI